MAYTPHQVVKAENIAGLATQLVTERMILPLLFRREGLDKFKGSKNDSVTMIVPGVLPYRTYGWRNDRTNPIVFDEYKENVTHVTFGDDIYSATHITDEQAEFDLQGWGTLLAAQTGAVATGLEQKAIDELTDAPYEVTVGLQPGKAKEAIIKARKYLNRLAPGLQGRRTLVVGTEIEQELLSDSTLNLAMNVGDRRAQSALESATLGSLYGFDIVVSQQIDPGKAYAFTDTAFLFLTAAPRIPSSAAYGATASANGVAVRWLRDYDMTRTTERSLVNTWQGFDHVKDFVVGVDPTTRQSTVSEENYLVRALEIDLDGTDKLPAADSELATITGIQA